jgi:hypothetical protein
MITAKVHILAPQECPEWKILQRDFNVHWCPKGKRWSGGSMSPEKAVLLANKLKKRFPKMKVQLIKSKITGQP